MTKDSQDTTPATKADIQLLKAAIRQLEQHIDAKAEETMRHFDVVVEKLKHDYDGIFGDRTSQHTDTLREHERRLKTVERKLGLVV